MSKEEGLVKNGSCVELVELFLDHASSWDLADKSKVVEATVTNSFEEDKEVLKPLIESWGQGVDKN